MVKNVCLDYIPYIQCNQGTRLVSYFNYAIWISLDDGSPSLIFDRVLSRALESIALAELVFSH